MSAVSVLVLAVLFVLVWVGNKISALLQVLKRIEARLTLLKPSNEEQTLMDHGGVRLRGGLEDRAMHPDIWFEKSFEKEHGLHGKELKEARGFRRYLEKRHRD